MSILIKGMEMPKNCEECRLNTMYGLPFACDGWCFAMSPTEPNSKSLATKTRPPHCPLIELPPHGDLVDRDRLTDTIDGITWYHQNRNKDMVEGANSAEEQAWYREQDVHEAVADAPVVIESEE